VSGTVTFAHTEEQALFRDSLRKFLDTTSPTTRVRQVMESESGFDAQLWKRMADELALPGIGIAEAEGGAGFGWTEVCIAMEEFGRTLCPSPFMASSVLSMAALASMAPKTGAALLSSIASGERHCALAAQELQGQWDFDAWQCTATQQGEGWRLDGVKHLVVDGAQAQTLLVVARQSDRRTLALFEVEADAEGLVRRPLKVIDSTRRLALVSLTGAAALLLGPAGEHHSGLERTLDLASIALANEMVGGMTRLFADTLAYTRLRVQFGRNIASFQAIKHRMAELLIQVELARSAAHYAASAADAGMDNLSYLASLAKSLASDAYLLAAQEAIQLHGGIGFTWDNDTHLWFKRAKSSEVFLGTPVWHRERMIRALEKSVEKSVEKSGERAGERSGERSGANA